MQNALKTFSWLYTDEEMLIATHCRVKRYDLFFGLLGEISTLAVVGNC